MVEFQLQISFFDFDGSLWETYLEYQPALQRLTAESKMHPFLQSFIMVNHGKKTRWFRQF